MLAAGSALGPYEILGPVGAGGMGEVYRAKDQRLGREVAVKILPEPFAQDAERLARFHREAKAVAALAHPNILILFDVGREQGISYAVMELLEGETLRRRVGRSPVPWRKTVELGIGLAEGLAAAHAKGIIHCDLKPENIFLTSDGQIKILDFGLVRLESRCSADQETLTFIPAQTQEAAVMGTAPYMSPEQVKGLSVDGRSDIFSLGCVLYEMVSGRPAFARKTRADTIAAILRDDPPGFATRGQECPAEVERVIHHCLEKNKEARFQSARDIAFALRAMLTDANLEKSSPVSQRRRWALLACLAVVLVTVFLAWAWTYRLRNHEENPPPSPAIDTVAVLPLANDSGDANMEFLGPGISESLAHSLSQLRALKVRPFSAVSRYKEQAIDPPTVGHDLRVQAIVLGRVAKHGDDLTISVELVNAPQNTIIWGKQFRRKYSEILAIQEEIATEIARKLSVRLSGEERQRLTKRYTENSQAYQLYLLGRYHSNKRTEEGIDKGFRYFQQATEEDPSYALAYAGLADSYALLAWYNFRPPKEFFLKAKAMALKALELDNSVAEAHASLAAILTNYDWDWSAAEKEYKLALDLNSNYATAHHWYSRFLSWMGRHQDAIAEAQLALELDPISPTVNSNLALIYYHARQYDLAIQKAQTTLEMDPKFALALETLGWSYVEKKKYDEALEIFERVIQLTGDQTLINNLAVIYAIQGHTDQARKVLDELMELAKRRYVQPSDIALIHALLGEKNQAFEWLNKAYDDRDSGLLLLKINPRLDCLRSDPRFSQLLRQMNLPP
jgi:eukaryotic-like serine/threonine-protein kinase